MKRISNTKKQELVGQKFELLVDVEDECNKKIPKGTILRIVAVAPKVVYTPKFRVERFPERYDSCVYFYNAVVDSQEKDYGNRIRENFVTIGIR